MILSNWITHQLYILYLVFYSCILTASAHASLNYYTKEEQIRHLGAAYADCLEQIKEAASQPDKEADVVTCPTNFDGAVCWPETAANSTAVIQCPSYINKFDTAERAFRYCTVHGNWSYNEESGMPIVEYFWCTKLAEELDSVSEGDEDVPVSDLMQVHLRPIIMMYTVGYSVSVISLLIALVVMLVLRRLHCPRNTIHMNMFVSFILRGGVQLLREHLLPYDSFYSDGSSTTESGQFLDHTAITNIEQEVIDSTGDWQCRMLSTIWMYTRLSNYVWIFVEGFYLHILIFINTFSDRSSIKWFILFGWGTPLLFVIPWMFVRIYVDNYECWDVYTNRNYRWIIEVPIVLFIVANFAFFLIIIRLLFTKLRASESSTREAKIYRYIKLAKSTLILIPLFGVHYVVFLFGEFFAADGGIMEVIRFYFDTFFTSFQGLMVSILFCFMNGEIRAEISKKWKRWRTMRTLQQPSTATGSLHLTASQRFSTISENESLTLNRPTSRNPSIQSSKSNTGSPPTAREETQFLLSIDDNQNEFQIKRNLHDQRS